MRRLKSIDSAKLIEADPGLTAEDARYRSMGLRRWPKVRRFRTKDGISATLAWSGITTYGVKLTIRCKLRIRCKR
jgi:hypothetical protein